MLKKKYLKIKKNNFEMKCRFCSKPLKHVLIDLGHAAPSNFFLEKKLNSKPEVWYPLVIYVCDKCWLVQTKDYLETDEIFSSNYHYFSSYSKDWLSQCKRYVDKITKKLELYKENKFVVEVASNDGYLLQYFKEKKIKNLGVEPTKSTAAIAKKKGLNVVQKFFNKNIANEIKKKYKKADLIIANNVLAHVPDINNFVKGFKVLLNKNGVATFEFQYLSNIIKYGQFDTLYHEHYSYLSLTFLKKLFKENNLKIYDVEKLPTHGGSLRVYVTHIDSRKNKETELCKKMFEKEKFDGMNKIKFYQKFNLKAEKIKYDLLEFLIKIKKNKKKVMAYGAASKGNTLLNYCGIRKDLVSCIIDANVNKINKYAPGSHIKVVSEKNIQQEKPEYILILPWNLKNEIINQLKYIKKWKGKFLIPVPKLKII